MSSGLFTERFPQLNEISGPRRSSKIVMERPILRHLIKTPRELASVTQHVFRQIGPLSKQAEQMRGKSRSVLPLERNYLPFERHSTNGRLPGRADNRICLDDSGHVTHFRASHGRSRRNSDTYVDLLNLPLPDPVIRISQEPEPLSPCNRHPHALPPTRAPRLTLQDLDCLAPHLELYLPEAKRNQFLCPYHKSSTCICHGNKGARPDFGKADSQGLTWATSDFLETFWFKEKRDKAFKFH
ncbi:hypothetical protein Ciccas_010233 [Cichlidogyrus casuarinus]|uniref:Uncharacterized protein n=1 Tax=Cichlidogyrus casuarinus TaxID=1844966 RepID=A0ABD2PWM7_9PLAT